MKSITLANVKNKTVLLRVDFNVPLKNGRVVDNKRIKESLPTIKYLLNKNAKIILVSHLGRPDGKVVQEFKMNSVAKELAKLLGKKEMPVLTPEEDVKDALKNHEIIFLENIRFYPEEEKNDLKFAKKLANLADIYVNDAFGVSHRAHASIVGVKKFLPSYTGFLVEKEVKMISSLLEKPKKPFVVILGGAKVRDKIKVIENLAKKCDLILIGGAMMFTFFKAKEYDLGTFKFESNSVKFAKEMLKKYEEKIVLPEDVMCALKLDANKGRNFESTKIPKKMIGLDIGRETINFYKFILKDAKTVFWNGPLGKVENPPFDNGTKEIAKFLANLSATVVIGGGDTAALIEKLKLTKRYSHVSTGGGASLEFLEGKGLVGLK